MLPSSRPHPFVAALFRHESVVGSLVFHLYRDQRMQQCVGLNHLETLERTQTSRLYSEGALQLMLYTNQGFHRYRNQLKI